MVVNKEVARQDIRYDRGDYIVHGMPGEYVTIAVMCVPGVKTPKRITMSWDEYITHHANRDDLGIGLTDRVWNDINRGMFQPPLETNKYKSEMNYALRSIRRERDVQSSEE